MRRFSVPILFALAFAMVLVMPYGAVGASSPTEPGAPVPPSVVGPVATVASHAHYWNALRERLLSAGISSAVVQRLGTASYAQWTTALRAWQDGASPLTEWSLLPQVGIPAFSWGQVLTAAAGGCVLGATVGALVGAAAGGIGALPGAGVGCVAGAASAAAADAVAQKWNNAESQSTVTLTYDAAQAAYLNEVHLEDSFAWSSANMTAETEYYYYRLASFAALGQLGNSSFNQTQDLIVSTIISQWSSVFESYYGTLDNAIAELNIAAAATGGGYAMPRAALGTGGGISAIPSVGAIISSGGTYVYLPSVTVGYFAYNDPNYCPGVDWFNGTYYAYGAGTMSLEGQTLSPVGTYGTLPDYYCLGTFATHQGLIEVQSPTEAYTRYSVPATPFCLPEFSSCPVVTQAGIAGGMLQVCFGSTAPGCASPDVIITPTSQGFAQLWSSVQTLEVNAVAQGQAYWQMLRNLGYTSASQVPPQYLIPPPYGALPPSLCFGGSPISLPIAQVNGSGSINGTLPPGECTTNLNITEIESLYYAYLDGIALFFNSTTWNQHQPRPCDSLGCAPWGNLNTYAVGDIYIPGAENSTGTGPEVYGNVSSWNVSGDQLILMPELNPLSIPVGKIYDIPQNAPLEVYVVQKGEDLNLNGNGSNVRPVSSVNGIHVLATTPGDAIYIQYCQIASAPQANCTLTMTTINDTATSLVCATAPPGSSSCPSPSGGGAFSLGGLLGALGSAICSLTGGVICGSPASILAGVLVAIVVLVIVAVAGIAVVRYAMGGNSRAVELRVTGKGGRK